LFIICYNKIGDRYLSDFIKRKINYSYDIRICLAKNFIKENSRNNRNYLSVAIAESVSERKLYLDIGVKAGVEFGASAAFAKSAYS